MNPATFGFTIAFLVASSMGTNVQFTNNCPQNINLIKTVNEQPPVQECSLKHGQSCQKTYSNQGMNFKNGDQGKTLAEFTFNGGQNHDQDFYDLSVIVGYDTAMQISTDKGGPTVTCKDPKCPDAYLYPDDNSKNHGIPTGGIFKVTFCP